MIEINSAYSVVETILNAFPIFKQVALPLKQPNHIVHNDKPDVCPEVYLGKKYDYPIYNIGFKTIDCDKNRFDEVVAFVVIAPNCTTARNIIQGIRWNYANVEAIIGIESSENCGVMLSNFKSSFKKLVVETNVKNSGQSWLNFIKETSTKFVVIGRDMYTFNNQSNMERLIRIISDTGVDAIGGAQRFEDGRWFSGCYQMSMKNYTLRLIEGYDLSFNACMYCDYLSTSFMSSRSTLLNTLNATLNGRSVFFDYFLKLFKPDQIGAMSCPDVMFSSDYNDMSLEPRSTWQQIAKKWQLNRFVLPNNKDVWFTCEEASILCHKSSGEVIPLCCLKELSDALVDLVNLADKAGIEIALIGGTALGALKFQNSLPWERDHDLDFRVNYTAALGALKPTLIKKGYRLEFSRTYYPFKGDENQCLEQQIINCNYYAFIVNIWHVEMTGTSYLMYDLRGNYSHPTRVIFNGIWIRTFTNPGLSMRVYIGGDHILQHLEHHSDLGRKIGTYYELHEGNFLPCSRPNFHGCLTNYLPDGNIQFKDIWI